MSVKVMSWVWEHSRSEGTDRLVLLAIADSASDDGGNAWPSVTTLADKAKVSERTVQRSVRALSLLGEVEVQPNAGRHGVNVYRVKMHPRQSVTPDIESPPSDSHPDTLSPVTPRAEGVTPRANRGDTPVTRTVLNHPTHPSSPPRSTNDPRFVEFWTAYPRKASKADAFKAFVKALRRAAVEDIIKGAQRFRDDPNRVDEFTAYPATWLNGDRWDDPPLPGSGKRRDEDDPMGWAR